MQASELINQMIPPLKMTDTTAHALVCMDEFKCIQLPVVHNGEFMGLISEDISLAHEGDVVLIKDVELQCRNCIIGASAHLFDVLKLAENNDADLVGVVDSDEKFIGVLTIKDTISALSQTFAVQSNGAILILSMKLIDYSLSEISRIVESEGFKILSSSLQTNNSDHENIKVTLKINSENIRGLVATLKRFNFNVIVQFKDQVGIDSDKDRLDVLLKFLDT